MKKRNTPDRSKPISLHPMKMALVIWASGFILVFGGCAPTPWPDTSESWRKVFDSDSACRKQADTDHEEYLVFIKKWFAAHPELTFTQLGNILQQHGKELQRQEIGNLKGMTANEKFSLFMRIDNDKHRIEWCETSYQGQRKILEDTDRELQRLQPRYLYIVP